jgi:FKBP-type peptidyl-prolyl cis-trans isomerase
MPELLFFPLKRQPKLPSSWLIACSILVFFIVWIVGCSTRTMIKTHSGLVYTRLKKGSGPKAKVGQTILLFETTRYRNGTILYSNEHTTTPVKVLIGGNQATQAVDEALVGMRVGEVKEIIAPPNLVKRTAYPPNVHPDSTLVIKLILYKII